ncbi:SDR family NAD(P)-dependent oxidoreductase [Timonella sp. A28]|uniref:SDR family NAD(P)-dependent oxidoreductase n=1 Tax=Timonella sp. A28 TaxID=3442640 RepID=UPI003EBDE946
MQEFDGLRAIVTGGASGIGAATVTALLQRGAEVVCLDRVGDTVPLGAHPVIADVSDDDAVRAGVAAAANTLGGIDILVNNAGISARGRVEDNLDEDWTRVLDVNVLGVVRVSRAALPFLKESRHGAIVNVGSIAGSAGILDRAIYQAAAGAVQALTLSMAADYVRQGIRVNAVNPGTVDTTMIRGHVNAADDPVHELRRMEERQATGRMVMPEEVAHAICYLASPLATATTGVLLAVDGGMHGLRVSGTSQSVTSGVMPPWLVTD